jgi:hypothetical protein
MATNKAMPRFVLRNGKRLVSDSHKDLWPPAVDVFSETLTLWAVMGVDSSGDLPIFENAVAENPLMRPSWMSWRIQGPVNVVA